MKMIFIPLFCFPLLALAANPKVEIKNFNFDYADPRGSGSASEFSYGGLKNTGTVIVDVEKIFEDFTLKVSGSVNAYYELKGAPDLLTKARDIRLKAFNLGFADKLDLSLEEASFNSPDDELYLKSFSLGCARNQALSEIMDQLVSGCIASMTLKSAKFSSGSLLENDLLSAMSNSLSGVGISNLDLKLSNGKYEMSAEVKAQVSGKARSKGQVSYDPARKLLTIKINEVKFSVLNVTNEVFDELKRNESEKMKVNKPYVYLTLK